MIDERVPVKVEEALDRLLVLPDYDPGSGPQPCVHTFVQGGPALLGAHWPLARVEELIRQYGVEESGPGAAAMRHGLVVVDRPEGPLFLETKA